MPGPKTVVLSAKIQLTKVAVDSLKVEALAKYGDAAKIGLLIADILTSHATANARRSQKHDFPDP
jgi:hypothetical protein